MFRLDFPGCYIQGQGALTNLWEVLGTIGRRIAVVTGRQSGLAIRGLMGNRPGTIELGGQSVVDGLCTAGHVESVRAMISSSHCDVVVAAGGGSVIDIAKTAAARESLPIVTVPTVAATDAATTGLSVFYEDDGSMIGLERLPCHPAAVIVDTSIILNAPARFLAAGVGEASSTWVEARYRLGCASGTREGISDTAVRCAESSFEATMQWAPQAYRAVVRKEPCPALDFFLEALFVESSIGAEGVGVALAHSLHDAYLQVSSNRPLLHGELVGLFSIAQLELAGDQETAERLRSLFGEVNLPTQLNALGLRSSDSAEIWHLAEVSLGPDKAAGRLPVVPSVQSVVDALMALS